MTINTFTCHCLGDTLDGLRDGLSHFSGPSRAAIVFAMRNDAPMFIFDPQNLLSGHEPRLKELYIDNQQWRTRAPIGRSNLNFSNILPENLPYCLFQPIG